MSDDGWDDDDRPLNVKVCIECDGTEDVQMPASEEGREAVAALRAVGLRADGMCRECRDSYNELSGMEITLGYADGTEERVTLAGNLGAGV